MTESTSIDESRGSRRAAPSFPTLTFLLIIVMAGLLVFFMLVQSGRLTAAKIALRQELSTEIQKAQAAVVPAEVAQRLMEKLSYLELRQTAVIDESRNSMQRQYYVFTTVAAFFGLFTVFFGYRQLLVESRGSDAREKHDQEMRNLVRSFQNNITTISSLITTLEKSFDYRKTISDELEKFQKRTQMLEHHQEEGDMAFTGLVSSLNSDALTVIPLGVDRAA